MTFQSDNITNGQFVCETVPPCLTSVNTHEKKKIKPISETVDRKFIDQIPLNDWSVLTDSGWNKCSEISKTIEYQIYELSLEDNYILECADTHIVFNQNYDEIFVKDLQPGMMVITDTGIKKVISIVIKDIYENMYDMSVDSVDHRYYTNGILSHNTTCAAGYLLWYAMFNDDVTILVAANKFRAANEIMDRIKFAYEELPDWLRAGVQVYNVQDIKFDNGSRIKATTTTSDSGRGMSISLLYCLDGDTTVRIRNKHTLIEEDISLAELYSRLYNIENAILDTLGDEE